MNHFDYVNGTLCAEAVPINDIARSVGTPFYCYATATLVRHFRVFDEALEGIDHLICFAVKANSNQAVLRTLAQQGAGADVVSGGELTRALRAGIGPERIVFSGVGKTADEMAMALEAGIHQFNVESLAELLTLSSVAQDKGVAAPISFRVNPDVDAQTHAKISTGKAENKFGVPWTQAEALYAQAADLPAIQVVGIDVHIGSQLTALAPFRAAFDRVAALVGRLRDAGHTINSLDLGGGLGIPYEPGQPEPPSPADYGHMVRDVAAPLNCQIIVEPGRLIAGNAGVLITQVLYVKHGEERSFVILDAAMNDLLRPAMYDAYHGIIPVQQPAPDAPRQKVDFVGPVCETGDTFARGRDIPTLAAGDLVAIQSAGAYGAVMANSYNSRPIIPEVMVKDDEFAIIRPRPSTDDLIALDTMPDWLDS